MGEPSQRPVTSLRRLREAEAACTRCPLYARATQVVPGEGRAGARLLLVGEQPGDQEDRQGRPFVGPAGRLLDAALADAGIERGHAFVTNAVKHFKYEMRGKRRLHKRPNAYEIDRCKWWLDKELSLIRPRVVVVLGATAARSLFGRPMAVGKMRGRKLALDNGAAAFITQHPSALLRVRDSADREELYRQFVRDLKKAGRALDDGA
jgi:uracil-DNA glycosylase